MANRLTDAQFAEIETGIMYLRNRTERLLTKYAKYTGTTNYSEDEIFDALNAAFASFEQAYELLD